MNIIENIALKRKVEVSLTGANIATFMVAAIFLPYVISIIILFGLAIYVVVNKQTRQMIFVNKNDNILKLFLAYSLIVSLSYRNWLGFATGIGIIFAVALGLYIRSIMTSELFEKLLHLICCFSLTSTGYAIIEKIVKTIDIGGGSQRISAVFFYPNYFGTIVGTVIIICAYKVLTKQNHKWFYYMVALINVISVYLCKSMFVWVEVFIGVAVLLIVLKRHRLLALWLFAAAIGAFLVFFFGVNIIPRLYDVDVTVRLRQNIWGLALEQIKQNPLFGHGFYSFIYLFDFSYLNQIVPHAHSLYIDMLLNFGIIGSGLFLFYIIKFFISVFKICFAQKNVMITSLILAVTASALVHGTTDITLLWFQTLPLFLFILSGLGAYEKDRNEGNISNKYDVNSMKNAA